MLKKIALSSVGLVLLTSPLFASASLIDDLQAQLQALLAQIAAIQAQQHQGQADDYGNGGAGSQANYCPTLTMTLHRGMTDATSNGQVSELQHFLSGYYDIEPQELVTGYFGRITESYVIQFQEEQGLPAFGIVGSLTRARIAQVCSGATTGSPRINFVSVTPGSTGVLYEYFDMPASTQIVFINNTNGERVNATSAIVSGSGLASLGLPGGTPGGTYYLKAQNYNSGAYIARTVTFTLESTVITQATATLVPLPTEGLPDGRLLRFAVTMPASTSTSIAQFNFHVTGPSQASTTVSLYVFSDPNFSSSTAQYTAGLFGSANLMGTTSDMNMANQTPLSIPAGMTYYFEVRVLGPGTGVLNIPSVTTSLSSAPGYLTSANVMQTRTQNAAVSLSVSPTSGVAPLSVNFSLVNGADGAMYQLDFGDSTGTAQLRNGGGVLSNLSHTYTAAGTSIAKLTQNGLPLCATCQPPVLATSTITVSERPRPQATCSITSDKGLYVKGDPIVVTWFSVNASTTAWHAMPGNINIPTNILASSGSTTLTADVIGRGSISLDVSNPLGVSSCSTVVTVTQTASTAHHAPSDPIVNTGMCTAGSPISVTMNSTDPDTDRVAYQVDVNGDGVVDIGVPPGGYVVSGATQSISTTYPAGVMSIKVRAVDDAGLFSNWVTRAFTCAAVAGPAPSCAISSDKNSYRLNEPVVLSWQSTNASSTAWHQLPGNITLPTTTPALTDTTTITADRPGDAFVGMDVSGQGGTSACSARFSVVTTPMCQLTSDKSTYVLGDAVTLRWSSLYAMIYAWFQAPGNVTVPSTNPTAASGSQTITADKVGDASITLNIWGLGGAGGCSSRFQVNAKSTPPAAPNCSISASPNPIGIGQSTILSWASDGAAYGSIDRGIGFVAAKGSYEQAPRESTAYTVVFTGSGGSATCSTVVTVTKNVGSCVYKGVAYLEGQHPSIPDFPLHTELACDNAAWVFASDNGISWSLGQNVCDINFQDPYRTDLGCAAFSQKAFLSATPRHGKAPLTVTVKTQQTSCQSATLSWGDGTPPESGCVVSTHGHTYGTPGLYVINRQITMTNGTSHSNSAVIRVDGATASANNTTQLAAALTALESVLKALLHLLK